MEKYEKNIPEEANEMKYYVSKIWEQNDWLYKQH